MGITSSICKKQDSAYDKVIFNPTMKPTFKSTADVVCFNSKIEDSIVKSLLETSLINIYNGVLSQMKAATNSEESYQIQVLVMKPSVYLNPIASYGLYSDTLKDLEWKDTVCQILLTDNLRELSIENLSTNLRTKELPCVKKFGWECYYGKYYNDCLDWMVCALCRRKPILNLTKSCNVSFDIIRIIDSGINPLNNLATQMKNYVQNQRQIDELIIKSHVSNTNVKISNFIRHEIKNSILDMKEIVFQIKQNIKQGEEFQEGNIISLDTMLERTHFTIMSDVLVREILSNSYSSQKCPVNLKELCEVNWGNDNCIQINISDDFPIIHTDRNLIYYIVKNAISNAKKYGKKNGNILVIPNVIDQKLIIKIVNEPGNNHEQLMKMKDAAKTIFQQGNKLDNMSNGFTSSTISSGDGGWIMRQCAVVLGGNVGISFYVDRTEFSFSTPIKLTNKLEYSEVSLENKHIICVDDSNVQRKLLLRYFKNTNIKSIITYGTSSDHIEILKASLINSSKQSSNDKFVIILDQNLDFPKENVLILGSEIINELREKMVSMKDVCFVIRSANDSNADIDAYLNIADGFISKDIISPTIFLNNLIEIIENKWKKNDECEVLYYL